MCGVWCVVCGVWCVVCGVWCVVCGVWCVPGAVCCARVCVLDFCGSYAADVGLRPSGWFPQITRVLIYRPTRGDGQLSWLLASAEWYIYYIEIIDFSP